MDDLRYFKKEDLTPDRRRSLKRYVENENMSVDHLRKVKGVRLNVIVVPVIDKILAQVVMAALCGEEVIAPRENPICRRRV